MGRKNVDSYCLHLDSVSLRGGELAQVIASLIQADSPLVFRNVSEVQLRGVILGTLHAAAVARMQGEQGGDLGLGDLIEFWSEVMLDMFDVDMFDVDAIPMVNLDLLRRYHMAFSPLTRQLAEVVALTEALEVMLTEEDDGQSTGRSPH